MMPVKDLFIEMAAGHSPMILTVKVISKPLQLRKKFKTDSGEKQQMGLTDATSQGI